MPPKAKGGEQHGARVIYDAAAGPNGLRQPFETFVDEVKDGSLRRTNIKPGDALALGDVDLELPPAEQPSERARMIKDHIDRGVCRVVKD